MVTGVGRKGEERAERLRGKRSGDKERANGSRGCLGEGDEENGSRRERKRERRRDRDN